MVRPAKRFLFRRNYFVKQGFQARFALYPLAILSAFLVGAGVYLHGQLRESFRFHLYLPHSQVVNAWELVAPALVRVALWGGVTFLLVLFAWVWGRFGRLRADLECLADWIAGRARGEPLRDLPRLRDPEVAILGSGLHAAACRFDQWERDAGAAVEHLQAAAAALGDEPGPAVESALTRLEGACAELRAVQGQLRVDEALR